MQSYTKEDVEKHGSDADKQWMIVDGKVIDISDYKFEHPGGMIQLIVITRVQKVRIF